MTIYGFKKNKKGSVLFDVLFIAIGLFVLGLVCIFTAVIYKDIVDGFSSSGSFTAAELAPMTDNQPKFSYVTDTLFIIFFFGLFATAIIGGFAIQSHPVFSFVAFIFLIVCQLVFIPLAEVFNEIVSDSLLVNEIIARPMMGFIMQYFPLIMCVVGILIAVVTYIGGE